MAKAPRPATDSEAADISAGVALRRQVFFWLGTAIVLALFLYVFSGILLPFVAGMALAYFLDPVADRLQRLGLSRLMATVVILIAFIVVVVLALVILVPVLATQMADFARKLPEYLTRLQSLITSFDPRWLEQRFGVNAGSLRDGLNSLLTSGFGFLSTVFTSIWSSGVALVSVVSLFVVTPVVAFYMLLDWDRMVAVVDSWVPRDYVETVRALARDINTATAGFVRGQGTLCLVLGVMYATGLTFTGLNFAILIGFFAGLISFIPYVGSLTGLVLAVGVAFVQFWPDWTMVVLVACVFFVGQFIEGNILQPRLVGKSVGLHPVWLMFALFAFGALFGFVGLLIAVPASAAIAVLVRFAIARYLESPLYKGHATEPASPLPADRGGGHRSPRG
ncbi:AI-2E family transporter [Mesorhizobium sp. M1C.F.Ca.ET.193.01.1.1]|uniref:AI-2E family transporter n=2 Tax=Mesorhizobium TaxID=68287 RepID=UPI000FD44D05|nr:MULTISPECIES: AI-2E family transporter [unclassified Mesorhizobium]TGS95796.1 AI-2E family transporter [bacterium M00.F.Ca.ET.177.01.1.1]TGQ51864.1 AI-2E family transporter [Mesorhizobium sp. M1C.F.Ca.ET.210.01.1.1]TGQ68108.1 AI-2E family transporter [Mesorhizobium sp. M1C.F.Ca.ET.212.01.1.1]TGR03387.1 AI-2E family transporter [Mesorhizobium sp. M1C.F.Ca.ET.204.01.1.1]TGR24004.1 AI-2E family transporter [Mesorhizobium sp. M1C.F.Ca.ET.196.01.1.1]